MASRFRDSLADDPQEEHEINVTPFIDVMLVLLIVFMVAAPLATVDVDVDLPTSTAQPAARPGTPVFLTLREDLSIHIGQREVPPEELQAILDRTTDGDKETRIFLRADRSVDYGNVMQLMNRLGRAGYFRLALVGLEVPPPP